MNKRLKQWGLSLLSLGVVFASACGTLPAYGPLPATGGYVQANAARSTQTLYTMPDDGDAVFFKAFEEAQRTIDIEVYMLSHRKLMPVLAAAAERGVQVRVLLEPEPYNPNDPNNPIPINNVTRKLMKDSKVMFRWSNKEAFTYTHQKSMVIDGKVAYIMTMNLSGTATAKNREFVIAERDPKRVAFVQRLFEADWTYTPFTETIPGNFVLSPINARSQFEGLIASARKTLTIEAEVFFDERLFDLIAQKQKEGVAVSILLPDPKHVDFGLEAVAEFRKRGITNIRWIKAPFVHVKAIIADGARAYIGSINPTSNSMDKNRELGLILDDRAIVGKISQVLARDWGAGQPFPAGAVAGPGHKRQKPPIDFDPAFL